MVVAGGGGGGGGGGQVGRAGRPDVLGVRVEAGLVERGQAGRVMLVQQQVGVGQPRQLGGRPSSPSSDVSPGDKDGPVAAVAVAPAAAAGVGVGVTAVAGDVLVVGVVAAATARVAAAAAAAAAVVRLPLGPVAVAVAVAAVGGIPGDDNVEVDPSPWRRRRRRQRRPQRHDGILDFEPAQPPPVHVDQLVPNPKAGIPVKKRKSTRSRSEVSTILFFGGAVRLETNVAHFFFFWRRE